MKGYFTFSKATTTQSDGAVEYTDRTSEEGLDSLFNECPGYDPKQSDGWLVGWLGFMAIKGCSAFPKAAAFLEPHHHIV